MERYQVYCKEIEPLRTRMEIMDASGDFEFGQKIKISFKSYHDIEAEWIVSFVDGQYEVSTLDGLFYRDTIEEIIIAMDTWYVSDLVYA
uniref:Uncharacterized protein n=1 Tax=Ochrobactrum phage ORM_20 TaxID=2985243 RepID=A0A9N6ZG21_9VIRU|nr:hypothetical protein ORM20_00150 [Ochrobactrum phage ORM_20]